MLGVPAKIVVVVPARNEEHRLRACLTALRSSIRHLRRQVAATPDVRVVLVLDRCTDRSAAVAAAWSGLDVIVTEHGRVGAARATGVRHALANISVPPENVWIANTDADSTAPTGWLLTHLRHAADGVDLLLGTVQPDTSGLPEELLQAWQDRHELVDGHRHVHGANLGVRADSYLRAGGFPDVAVHEDVMLVDIIRQSGARVVSTRASPVTTSARLSGRTPGGMAGYLRELIAATNTNIERTA